MNIKLEMKRILIIIYNFKYQSHCNGWFFGDVINAPIWDGLKDITGTISIKQCMNNFLDIHLYL